MSKAPSAAEKMNGDTRTLDWRLKTYQSVTVVWSMRLQCGTEAMRDQAHQTWPHSHA
ncbi:MAG: hypothetical protein HY268_18790 [Deltaproteobacteria bacterium]|nr:hypothetical protein [Deltaproteobacteria bacterium]